MTSITQELAFIKSVPYEALGQYPMECNFAVYNAPDNLFFEMETYGPQQTLLPGHSMEIQEKWRLIDHRLNWDNPAELQALI